MAEINYEFYENEDFYSDGEEIENRIMEYVSEYAPKDYGKVMRSVKHSRRKIAGLRRNWKRCNPNWIATIPRRGKNDTRLQCVFFAENE